MMNLPLKKKQKEVDNTDGSENSGVEESPEEKAESPSDEANNTNEEVKTE